MNRIKFHNMDCMDFMKKIPDNHYELAIVDVPYGGEDATNIKSTKGLGTNHYAKRTEFEQFENIAPDLEYFKELERVSKNRIIWGFNFLENCYERGGIIVWNKYGTAFGEAEIALATMFNSVRIYNLRWNGFLKHEGAEEIKRWHSTAKPRRLYEYLLLNYAKKDYKILDTHGGSMSIARAVYDVNKKEKMNLTLDVVEISKTFYEKGMNDFNQHTSQQTLF
ncbi:MAG: site-specific DNA-methyltransferase [Bacteroidota bacterium]